MARKKSVLLDSSCRTCLNGLRTSSWAKMIVQGTIRKVRHKTAAYLKAGEYDKAQDVIISTGYLD